LLPLPIAPVKVFIFMPRGDDTSGGPNRPNRLGIATQIA
jgi:hypothetical protein